MRRIGLLSDTHSYLDDQVFRHFETCDEIWHAGDFGALAVAEKLKAFRPLVGVYGNIDGNEIRSIYPEKLRWVCEGVDVFMTHIGGSPPKYNAIVKNEFLAGPPKLFICGHSHILKIQFDDQFQCLYMNPGAAGNHGWHKIRTLVRFSIDGIDLKNCEVVVLGSR
jgi:putative phosphoesterase